MDRHGSDGNAARLQVDLRDGLVVRDLRRVHPDAAQARRARHDHFVVVRTVVVRLRQREAPDLAGLGRGQDAIADVEVAFRVGERLGVLVRREGRELREVLPVGRLPDTVFLRRIHRHHVHRSAHDRDVDGVGIPAIEGVAPGSDVPRGVHRGREEPDRVALGPARIHDVVDATLERRRLAEVDPTCGRGGELAVDALVPIEKSVPRAVHAPELPSGRIVELPVVALVEVRVARHVVVVRHGDAAVRERHQRQESLVVLAGLVFLDRVAVVAVGLARRDRSHLMRERIVSVEPVLAAADAVAGEVEVPVVLAEVPRVGVELRAVELVRGIPVDGTERTRHPVAPRILGEEAAVVGIVFARVGRARPDPAVGELLEGLDLLRARAVLVRPRRRRAGEDRDDRHGTSVVAPVAAADVDATVDVFEAMAAARGLVVRRCAVSGLQRREKVF